MAKKTKITFLCTNCGYSSLKWLGRCPECAQWNSFEEHDEKLFVPDDRSSYTEESSIRHIDEIDIKDAERIVSGYPEFNRIMGGGIVTGSYNLISGNPGVGKSTLMLQVALSLSEKSRVLYLSAEESSSQVKLRFDRLNKGEAKKNLYLSAENNIDRLLAMLEKESFDIIFIDSIQTVFSPSIPGIPGSVSQIKECAVRLLDLSKRRHTTIFVVGHVTKSGNIAGPMLLEHMVDTVLLFDGDPTLGYRVLRTSKNRFGATDEIGIFTMTSRGLEEVENPSQFFISGNRSGISGTSLALVLEGSRPFLIEVQSLTSSSHLPQPRRVVSGADAGRLSMITAVLEKRGDVFFSNFDIFVNVVGGLKFKTPASDLPIASSLLSSIFNIAVPNSTAFVGEIGLAGEIREVPGIDLMIKEGSRLGLKKIYVPKMRHMPKIKEKVEIVELKDIFSIIEEIRTMKIFE